MEKLFFMTGAGSGFIAVALGAFAAHGLKARLTADLLDIFETGARYQMYHALALLRRRGRAHAGRGAGRQQEAGASLPVWLFFQVHCTS